MEDSSEAIRVLAMVEASTITGPAKNFLQFAQRAAQPGAGRARAVVSVATFVRGASGENNAFIEAARRGGIQVFPIPERRAFDWRVVPQLTELAKKQRPNIIQSHSVKSHFLVRLSGLHRRVPWIAFHHGYTTTNTKVRAYNQLDRWSLRGAERLVTVCGPFADQLRTVGVPGHQIAIRHNMVQPFVPAPDEQVVLLRRQLGISDAARVVFCAGRLSHEKGHSDLVRAIAEMRQRSGTPPFCVVIAGDGPEREPIEALRTRLRLENELVLPGYQPDLRPFFSMADAAVLPSHSEGSPNFLLEAMAAGLATVATAVGGVPEIATDGEDALLVPKGDSRSMASALQRLLTDPDLRRRIGDRARDVTRRYTPEEYCRSVLDTYQVVMDRRGATGAPGAPRWT